jgi:hypothetical protein
MPGTTRKRLLHVFSLAQADEPAENLLRGRVAGKIVVGEEVKAY